MKVTYDDTRDIAIRCIDKLIDLKILSEDEHNFEIQDLIQDEINGVLELDIDDNFEITIKTKEIDKLKKLVSLFEHRKLFTNDSILMVGDLEKLKKLINKL